MLRFSIFGRKDCEICQKVVKKIEYYKNNFYPDCEIVYYDTETVLGMATAAFFDVYEIPTVVVEKDGKVLSRWIKTAPEFACLNRLIKEAC